MKASKITIIQDYLKQYQPTLITINKVKKKKDNFIVNCTIQYKQTIKNDPNNNNTTIQSLIGSYIDSLDNYQRILPTDPTLISYIYELKTYIIPKKDITFPTKRKSNKLC